MKTPTVMTLRNELEAIPVELLPIKKQIKNYAALNIRYRDEDLAFSKLLCTAIKSNDIDRLLQMGSFLSNLGCMSSRFFYGKAYQLRIKERRKAEAAKKKKA